MKNKQIHIKNAFNKEHNLKFFDDEKIQASVIYSFIAMRINWKRSINPKGVHETKGKMRKKKYILNNINQSNRLIE